MYGFISNAYVPTSRWRRERTEGVNYVIAVGRHRSRRLPLQLAEFKAKCWRPVPSGCNESHPLQCSRYGRRVPRRGLHCRGGHDPLHALWQPTFILRLMHSPISKPTTPQPNLHPSKILRTDLRQQAKATIQRGAHMILL